MSHKENIAPLSSTRRKENSLENLKGEATTLTKDATMSFKSCQQKQLSLKTNMKIHTDKKENNDEKSKSGKSETTIQSKTDFAQANIIPTAPPLRALRSTSTIKPLVFKDEADDKKTSSKNEERPMLLQQSKERVQVHHKPLKTLQTPIIDIESKEVAKLKKELKEKEQLKEDKLKELSQLQELLKVYKEHVEQQSMLEEAEEMITTIYESFDSLFSSTFMSYTMRCALKEQQQELLLNELSEINYRLSEQAEEEDSE